MVESKNQSGGITAHTINFNNGNPPNEPPRRKKTATVAIVTLIVTAIGVAIAYLAWRHPVPTPPTPPVHDVPSHAASVAPVLNRPGERVAEVPSAPPRAHRPHKTHEGKMSNENNKNNVFNVTSNNQSGGVTAGQIVVGAPDRHLIDEMRRGLLSIGKDNPVRVFFLNNDSETVALTTEIYRFLQQHGYKLAEAAPSYFMALGPAQPQDVNVNVNAGSKDGPETWVTVRPR